MYGRDDSEWDELLRTGTAFLVERARLRRTTTYTELDAALVRRTGLRGFDFSQADERAAVGELLGRIVRADLDSGRYGDDPLMLSALVIYLNGNDAGSGFYALAASLGLSKPGTSKEAFWIGQLKGLYAYYAPGEAKAGSSH